MEKMRVPNGTPLSSLFRKTEAGSVTVPSLFLALILVGAMFSCLSIGALWRSKMGLQLRLDRCVEKTAMELESLQSQIEASNLRMKLERASAIAAAVPTAGASLKAAQAVLIAESLYQEVLRGKWRARQVTWITRRGCDGKRDAFLPLPGLEWWRPPDDAIGPLPLQWKGSKEQGLTIRLWNGNRFSSARVAMMPVESKSRKWEAKWAPFPN